MPPAVVNLLIEGLTLESDCLATSTADNYRNHAIYYLRFCFAVGLDKITGLNLLQPDESVIYAYVSFLARSCKHSTIKVYISGLKFYLQQFGEIKWRSFFRVNRLMKGIKRTKGDAVNHKTAITPALLLLFQRQLPDTASSQQTCVQAAMQLGVFAMLRRSNLVPAASTSLEDLKYLRRQDITYDARIHALKITVRASKTN
jgi:hypothetical protein